MTGHFQKDCRGSRRREEDSYIRRRNYEEDDYRRRDDYRRSDRREGSIQENRQRDYKDERKSVKESMHEIQAPRDNDPRLQQQE